MAKRKTNSRSHGAPGVDRFAGRGARELEKSKRGAERAEIVSKIRKRHGLTEEARRQEVAILIGASELAALLDVASWAFYLDSLGRTCPEMRRALQRVKRSAEEF